MSKLVSSGDSIKIWDTSTYEPLYEWSSSSSNSGSVNSYSCNSWSCDNGCVATSIKGKGKVVLTYSSKSSKYTSQEIHLQTIVNPQAIQFPRTSQKSLIVSSDNHVHMYDLTPHRQKISKSFQLKSKVSSVTVNYCDAYIAAGCEDGGVQLITVASNQVSAPMLTPKCVGHKISSVRYNAIKPSLLGASCESGIVTFFDCNTNKNLFSLNPHCAPATGLTFSPINDTLVLSVGLDKKMVCSDLKTKKIVMTMQCEHPLTCADFDQDGVSLAVGTSRGKMLIYDLRSPKSPIHNIFCHNTSVSSVLYRPKQSQPSVSSNPLSASKSRSLSRLTQQKSAPSLKTVQEEGKENNDPSKNSPDEVFVAADEKMFNQDKKDESLLQFPSGNNKRESLSSMLFSPLRDSDTSFNSHVSQLASVTRDPYPGDKRLSEARRLSSDSVFSPLRDSPGPGSASVSFKRTPINTPPTMSPLTIIREESDPTSMTQQIQKHSLAKNISSNKLLTESMTAQDKLSLESLGSFVKETRCPSPLYQPQASNLQQVHSANQPNLEDTSLLPATQSTATPVSTTQQKKSGSVVTVSISSNDSETEAPRPKSSELQNVLTAFPHLVNGSNRSSARLNPDISSAVDKISDKLTCDSSPLMTGNKDQNMNNAEAFQREYISSVVSEAMQEWCDGVDKRLWSFHYSLLRQLQTHQEETRSMLSDMSGMSSVREELERLRHENSELRKFFGTNP